MRLDVGEVFGATEVVFLEKMRWKWGFASHAVTEFIRETRNIMTSEELKCRLLEYIRPVYPGIEIEVLDQQEGWRQIFFTEEKFRVLYPLQRYHNLINQIPHDFYEQHLTQTTWYELAPGENPNELKYQDSETTESIKEIILDIIKNKTCFIQELDSEFLKDDVVCHGDFRYAKEILNRLNFTEEEQFDIFHVLMNEGGYCDCEILYNVFHESEYAKKYWKNRCQE